MRLRPDELAQCAADARKFQPYNLARLDGLIVLPPPFIAYMEVSQGLSTGGYTLASAYMNLTVERDSHVNVPLTMALQLYGAHRGCPGLLAQGVEFNYTGPGKYRLPVAANPAVLASVVWAELALSSGEYEGNARQINIVELYGEVVVGLQL